MNLSQSNRIKCEAFLKLRLDYLYDSKIDDSTESTKNGQHNYNNRS